MFLLRWGLWQLQSTCPTMICLFRLFVFECFCLSHVSRRRALVVAEAPRAGPRSCVVVICRLRLARYVAIACLRFPLLLRRPVNDVGFGWVGCCAARCRVDVRCSRRLRCPRVCRLLSHVKRKVEFSVELSVVAAVLSLLSPMSPHSHLRPLPMSKRWFNAIRLRR